MKHQSNFSYVGYGASLFVLIFMGVRYLWIYYDPSEFILWTAVSIFVAGLSWLYSQNLDSHNRLEAIEEHLEDISK